MVNILPNSIKITNLPTGSFWFSYDLINLDLCGNSLDGGLVSIHNYPVLSDCSDCNDDKLFCYDDFEDYGMSIQFYVELGNELCLHPYNQYNRYRFLSAGQLISDNLSNK